ncbi:hypothetical protein [Amycolatopsis suaedae]|uniref:Bacterial Ig domain-containing protein n=1 Tax=Amycolatopsis suaedae TaxID=2510978 RepID=A0A4Q7J5A5_9PSEU|nr:hypothetical protein [Amycolatopsis suaedae]RZQ62269.1 hypothetical protein EWH70_18480 [Amycolatopsis suaedae]
MRVAAVTTLGAALAGGVIAPGVAAADDSWVPLTKAPGAPERMQFTVDQEDGVAVPGKKTTVAVEWSLWNIWSQFQADKAGNGDLNAWHDLLKVGAWQTATLMLEGQPCEAYSADQSGSQKFELGEAGGFNLEPVDAVGLVGQVRNLVADLVSGVAGDNAVSEFVNTKVRATCTFIVPENPGDVITVGGDVGLNNLFGLVHSTETGRATLPVKAPKAPLQPQIALAGVQAELEAGAQLHGTAEAGTDIYLRVNGNPFPQFKTVTDKQGNWTLKLPEEWKPGEGYQVQAVSQRSEGGLTATSDSKFITIKSGEAPAPVVTKPVITSPAGDVRPGDELTVTGSDGSVLTVVDQNGTQIAGPVVVADGKARIKLPADLKDGSQIKVIAKPKDGNGKPVESDPKPVKVEKPEFYQMVVPTAKPGTTDFLDVNFEPKNGDILSIAGKTVTLKAPSGFSFGDVSYVIVGNNGNGEGHGINNLVKRNDDGTIAVTLPSAEELKRTYSDGIKAFKLSITAIAKADADATVGGRTDGQATLDGYPPVILEATVIKP